jgi:hypothetical protein
MEAILLFSWSLHLTLGVNKSSGGLNKWGDGNYKYSVQIKYFMKRYNCFIFMSLFLSLQFVGFGQSFNNLSDKDIFKNSFPIIISFAGEYIGTANSDYNAWESSKLPSDAVLKKYVRLDELGNVNLETQKCASDFTIKYPEKLMLLHLDAWEHRNDQPDVVDRFFPGHWLSLAGSTLLSPISDNTLTIAVQKSKMFDLKFSSGSYKYPILLMVELDAKATGFGINMSL